jgi:tetratricopeptide (TPR) repeat protein
MMFSAKSKSLEFEDKKVSILSERYRSLLTDSQRLSLEQLGGSKLVHELHTRLKLGLDIHYNRMLTAKSSNPKHVDDKVIDLAAKRTQLASAIAHTESAYTQAGQILSDKNSSKQTNGLQKIAADVDAIIDSATNGLLIGKIPHLIDSGVPASEWAPRIKGRSIVLQALHDCLTTAKDAGASHQVRDAARTQLQKAIDNLSNQLKGSLFEHMRSPEKILLQNAYNDRSADPSVELSNLQQALNLAEEAIQTERTAKALASQHDREKLIAFSQVSLQEGDLKKALCCIKALAYSKDASPSDVSALAQIYRRAGMENLEFLTLREMLATRHLSSASDCNRLVELTFKPGVDSALVGEFLDSLKLDRPLSSVGEPRALHTDLMHQILHISQGLEAPAHDELRSKKLKELQVSSLGRFLETALLHPLPKARAALNGGDWAEAAELASTAYTGSTNPVIQQRALLIGAEAALKITGDAKHETVQSWLEHSFAIGVTPEAIQILRASTDLSFVRSYLAGLEQPTYDSIVTEGVLALEQKDLSTARAKFEVARQIDATRPEALCGLGSMEERRSPLKALEYFQQALTMWPSYDEARLGLQRCNKQLEESAGKMADAEALVSVDIGNTTLQEPAAPVADIELTQTLQYPPTKLLNEALALFSQGDPSTLDSAYISKRIRRYLREKCSAFREVDRAIRPDRFLHTWGADLQNILGELVDLVRTLQEHPNPHTWSQLRGTISSQFGAVAPVTAPGIAFSNQLKILAPYAEALDPASEVLSIYTSNSQMNCIIRDAQRHLSNSAAAVGTSLNPDTLAGLSSWALDAFEQVKKMRGDLMLQSAALTMWSERLAATVYQQLSASRAPLQPVA